MIEKLPSRAARSSTATLLALMTHERWIEVARIVLTGVIALLYWRQWVSLPVLWVAVAIGLYPLVRTGLLDLLRERKIGTEIFVTIATLVAVFGGETVAGAVLMVIILFAGMSFLRSAAASSAATCATVGDVQGVTSNGCAARRAF